MSEYVTTYNVKYMILMAYRYFTSWDPLPPVDREGELLPLSTLYVLLFNLYYALFD